jgi:hypothetical protein
MRKPIQEQPISEKQLVLTANRLQKIGAGSYRRADDGHYEVITTTKQRKRPGTTVREVVATMHQHVPALPRQLDSFMKAAGFTGFEPMAEGSTADILRACHANGHDYALRIVPASHHDTRITSPQVVQPYKTYTDENCTLELMPIVQILHQSDSDIPARQKLISPLDVDIKRIEHIVKDTARAAFTAATSWVMKDMGILPDGTPVQVDPGQITYIDEHMGMKPDLIRAGLASLRQSTQNMPAQFQWFNADGTWKQDRFFINPFVRKAYYQGFIIA